MIEAMKQALEALEKERPYLGPMPTLTSKAITSLRQAIKELESQEPVAWSCWQSCLNDDGTQTSPWVHRLSKFKPHESIINKDIVPLYAHPPQRTDQEQNEPFGYFRAEPFGWTDCVETDEGAIALYQAPQRTWVGLSDDEVMSLLPGAVRLPPGWIDTVRAIEAKLKEKNNV